MPLIRAFACVEQCRQLIEGCGITLQLTQLEPGSFSGDLVPLQLGPLRLLRVRLSGPLHVRGDKNARHQLVCMELTHPALVPPSRSHGYELPATAVCGLARSGEVHLTVPAGSEVALLIIDRHAFQQRCALLGCQGLDERSLAVNWLSLDPRRFEDLRLQLRQLLRDAVHNPAALLDPQIQARACDNLLPVLIEALVHAAGRRDTLLKPPSRIELVKQVQRWFDQHPDQCITLQDLCTAVYASRRSLIQGFREHLGMGPMAYLKLQRLHAARRSLLAAASDPGMVTAVASRHGFLNLSHFARDYCRLFGELPSATLQQSLPSLLAPFNG